MKTFQILINTEFWLKNSAVYYAIFFSLGIADYLSFHPLYALPPLFFTFLLFSPEYRTLFFFRLLAGLLLMATAYFYTLLLSPPLVEKGYFEGVFSIHSVAPYTTSFKKGWIYKGRLEGLPCSVTFFGPQQKRYPADHHYFLQGTLSSTGNYYRLKPTAPWIPLTKTYGIAEKRFLIKEKVRKFFTKHLTHPELLSTLITGDTVSRKLSFDFARLGLNHLLAISGFHFTFLTTFLAALLRPFLPRKALLWTLLIATNLYLFFLGATPSIQRAWIIIQLFFIGKLLGRRSFHFQLLGIAMLIEMVLSPYVVINIGFQLSFLSCFGILFFYYPISRFLHFFFKKRPYYETKKFSLLEKHIYLLGSFFKESFALILSVNVTLLPLLFFHFHKFPCLSLFYNLFIPLFTSLIMTLTLLASLFPFLFAFIDYANSYLLALICYPIHLLDFSLYAQPSFTFLLLYFFLLFPFGIWLSKHLFDKKAPLL